MSFLAFERDTLSFWLRLLIANSGLPFSNAFRSSSAHAIAISPLDAVHLAVIAEFEQVRVVADEELEQPLAGLRLPRRRRGAEGA